MIVKSFDELRNALNTFGCPYPTNQGQFFFRGIPYESFELIPPLFYPPAPKSPKEKEIQILNEFIKQTNFGKDKEYNKRIWLNAFYARNWGLKLRLIDWTIDLSVALFFMLQNAGKENAALFLLPKATIKYLNEFPNISYFDFDQTIVLNPPFYLEDVELMDQKIDLSRMVGF